MSRLKVGADPADLVESVGDRSYAAETAPDPSRAATDGRRRRSERRGSTSPLRPAA